MVCELLEFDEKEDCILRTGRLVLRRPEAGDAAAIARLANDRVIAENTASIPYPYTLADAEKFIALVAAGKADAFLASAEIAGAQTLIGCGGFGREDEMPELGYWIGEPYRGQGFATELSRALIDYAFERIGAERIAVACRVTNTASRRVIEKCGFQWVGCGLAKSVGFNGAFPVDRFRLERGIWKAIVAWGAARHVQRSLDVSEAKATR